MRALSRRRLLLAASTCLLAAGCANAPSGDTIATDAGLIGAGISTLVAALQAAGVAVPQDALDKVNAAIADIQKNADAISGALDPAPLLQQIMGGLKVVSTLLAPFFPYAPVAYQIVSAAVSLGTYLLSLAGVNVASVPRPAVSLRPYSPDDAREILRNAAR